MLSKQEVQSMYQSRAKHYDFAMQRFRLIGLRLQAYRLHAVKLLHLQRGDCVVDLGCGTGLNFPLLIEQIGSQGRLIGVDMTPEMLKYAQERIERSGWKNVELVQSDIAVFEFPERVNGVLSTGVFGHVADFDNVIKQASHALVPDGSLVILDGKLPERLPQWLFRVVLWLSRPFGATRDYYDRRTWESVVRYFEETAFEQTYGGMVYISSGTAPFGISESTAKRDGYSSILTPT